jgi:hypothetical protein
MKFYLIAQQKLYYKYFHKHSSTQGDSWIVDISVRYGWNSQWLGSPDSNYCKHTFWTVRQNSWKVRKTARRRGYFEIQAVSVIE